MALKLSNVRSGLNVKANFKVNKLYLFFNNDTMIGGIIK
ncbi:hypothetical protein GMMP13_1500004 [Candidatus Magnetomoraceae bacterium gMMP-13]